MLQLDFDETQSAVRYCSSVEYNCLLVTPNPEKASKGPKFLIENLTGDCVTTELPNVAQ